MSGLARNRLRGVIGGLALTGAIIASSLAATASFADQTPPSSAVVNDASRAPDQVSAEAIARKFGHSVAIDNQTSETTQVSALPSGVLQLESDTLPTRVSRGGKWVGISTDLVTVDGVVAPQATAVGVKFSAGGAGPMAQVQTSTGKWVSESWPYGDLPTPTLSGATATYASVLPGVDLKLTANVIGMSEVLVVKNAKAAADPRVTDLTLAIGGAAVLAKANGTTVASASDGSKLTASIPTWWDSSKPGADAAGPAHGDTARTVTRTAGAAGVSLEAKSVATAEKITYPLYIDPDWTSSLNNYWYIDRGYPTSSFSNGATARAVEKLGHASAANSSDHVEHLARDFWEMNTAPLLGKQIIAAQFSVTQLYAGSCSPTGFGFYQLDPSGLSAGQTWNTSPSGAWSGGAFATANGTYGRSGCSPTLGPSAVAADATGAVANIVSASQSSLFIGMAASNESADTGYKEFAQGASLIVTYNSIPGSPAAADYSSPARTCSTDSANPTALDGTQVIGLQATANDADTGQNLATTFSIGGVAPTSFSWSQSTPSEAAGTVSVTVPANTMSLGGVYSWSAQTTDGIATGAASPSCYFRIVNTNPALPTVTKTSSGSAVVGQPITVSFGSAANDGVSVFAFWWADGTGTTPPAPPVTTAITPGGAVPGCGAAEGAVRFVCPDSGSFNATGVTVAPIDTTSTLWVASYNAAGRVSLASGVYAATPLHVSSLVDTSGVSNAVGHIWDTTGISTSATAVPDLNTTTGTSGTTTRQTVGAPLNLVNSDFYGIPTTMLSYTSASSASQSARTAIDTSASFTASAWLEPSSTSSGSIAHVAMSESNVTGGPAFTLGTGVGGVSTFCRTNLATNAQACATGPAIPNGDWTLVTGIWDQTNQSLRVLVNDSVVPQGTASQPVSGSNPSPNGWLCVGGSCALVAGSLTTATPWDGQIFRPSVFPGVLASTQLDNLYNTYSPNDDPPADESIGAVVNLGCDQIVTPQNMYDFNPNYGSVGPWTPDAGTSAAKAITWNGVACRWIDESSGTPMDVSVASIVDRGTMLQLQNTAAAGTAVSGLGDAAYFGTVGGDGELQVFSGSYWITFRSPWIWSAGDAAPLPADVLTNLP